MELSIYYKNIQWPKFQVVVIDMLITNRRLLNYLIDGKDKPAFHASHHVTAITFLLIGIIATGIFVCTLVLNQIMLQKHNNNIPVCP
jgi:hypothetical protein